MTFSKSLKLSTLAISVVALATWTFSNELCRQEINSTNGGEFDFGHNAGYVKYYCTISGILDPVIVILGVVILIAFILAIFRTPPDRAALPRSRR